MGRIGTSLAIQPFASISELANAFDITSFGRATAKFDPEELRQLNARILQLLDYEDVASRLQALAIDKADFWLAVRGNLNLLHEAGEWWQICHQDITPVIEDKELCLAAIEQLPDGEISADIWKSWTSDIASATGKKGRGLFMPLRLALTGRNAGPEIAGLLPFMGRERIIARLSGATS